MNAFRQYFEDNPEIFAALVAAIAIVGGLLGSIIGAKIQANGGRDQAAAAREAAEIAAEAQRVAALWNVRQVQVAELIQRARVVQRQCRRYYAEDTTGGALLTQLNDAQEAMYLKQAELELIVPNSVAQAIKELMLALKFFASKSSLEGTAVYAFNTVHEQAYSEDSPASPEAAAAAVALDDMATAQDSGDQVAFQRAREVADQALRSVAGLHRVHVSLVLWYVERGGPTSRMGATAEEVVDEKMTALVEAAREMLRSEDDVAPAVPSQRRRWWRAA
ncbi:hypothetical protein ACH4A8_41110 [Streptomyces vietnamensis]|uniref:hypothetical protein n=1 Tax=Streptomyces vietnamensis TaxID=362257 RepID=UPI00378EB75C